MNKESIRSVVDNMRKHSTFIIVATLALLLGFFLGICLTGRYYFKSEKFSGQVAVVRADKLTGRVDLVIFDKGEKITIEKESKRGKK